MTVDMLRLTGDPFVADELELSTLNGAAGAQHPSGRWCTYNTPMDGAREASAHSIVFQARAGTPELNCCSVNGPRAFGMLTEWAVMSDADGLVVNYYGPGQFLGVLSDQTPVKLRWQTGYPVSGKVRIEVEPPAAAIQIEISHTGLVEHNDRSAEQRTGRKDRTGPVPRVRSTLEKRG